MAKRGEPPIIPFGVFYAAAWHCPEQPSSCPPRSRLSSSGRASRARGAGRSRLRLTYLTRDHPRVLVDPRLQTKKLVDSGVDANLIVCCDGQPHC